MPRLTRLLMLALPHGTAATHAGRTQARRRRGGARLVERALQRLHGDVCQVALQHRRPQRVQHLRGACGSARPCVDQLLIPAHRRTGQLLRM